MIRLFLQSLVGGFVCVSVLGLSVDCFADPPSKSTASPSEKQQQQANDKELKEQQKLLQTVATQQANMQKSYARGRYFGYLEGQQKLQSAMMQLEQKAMTQAIAQQQAIDKKRLENRAIASKTAHEKEEQRRQDLIAKRKAAQAEVPAGASPDKTPDPKK